jgi:hypothetical protein
MATIENTSDRVGRRGDAFGIDTTVTTLAAIPGTTGSDTLTGTAGPDTISGDRGNDLLRGGGGNDTLNGNPGDDTLLGQAGNDFLVGSARNDRLEGGDGCDTLRGGDGNDTLIGGDSPDRLAGGDGNDHLAGRNGDDTLKGNQGDDTLQGQRGDDLLTGGDGADRLTGGQGNDHLAGGDGADRLHGGRGDDTITGGAGDDRLKGAAGDDSLDGGPGTDTAIFAGKIADYAIATHDGITTVTDLKPTVNGDDGTDTIANIESLQFRDGVIPPPPPCLPAFSELDLGSLDGSNGFALVGAQSGIAGGFSVSTAGDVNGDGFDDLIIGAPGTSYGRSPFGSVGYESGSAYVVFGHGDGFPATIDLGALDGSNGFRLDGYAYYIAGTSVDTAGDINGDGFDDLLIGAPTIFDGAPGAAYVVFGQAAAFAATIDLTTLDGSNGFRFVNGTELGESVAAAGDVNGDGFNDIIVGAPGADATPGNAYVLFGHAGGFGSTVDLSALNGTNGFRIDGAGPYDNLGYAVSGAGDINGDGFDDLVIGVGNASVNGLSSGATYVLFGHGDGFPASINVAALDGANGFRLDGAAAGDSVGDTVSSTGDVNGDGIDDIIIGSFAANASYVVFGHTGGFDATMDLSALDGSNGFRLDGSGPLVVSDAGDINGDGFADLLVGASLNDTKGIDAGAAYVIFGHADGFAASIDLTALDGTDGFRLDGATAGDGAGQSVSAAGDVNADGFGDLLVGAPEASPGGVAGAGIAYVVFGGNFGCQAMPVSVSTAGPAGGGSNSHSLSVGDVLDTSDTPNPLLALGSASDHVGGSSHAIGGGPVHETHVAGPAPPLIVDVDINTAAA